MSLCRGVPLVAVLLLGLMMCTGSSHAQATDSLPFACGERLTFTIRAAKFGTIGHAVMAVTGGADIRGVETMLISMDTHMGVLFMRGSDANRSWIDPARMTSLRFEKHQRRPFSSTDDSVDIYPDLHFWSATGTHADSGSTAADAPLDELSFLYFLRTVSLAPDSTYAFNRHYDKRRAPSTARLVKHELVRTPAGEFNTDEIEVRVKDGDDWKDEWTVRYWISDGPCRLPVRMESAVPILGAGVMTLDSAVAPTCASGDAAGLGGRRTLAP